jgi:hypothetical protein
MKKTLLFSLAAFSLTGCATVSLKPDSLQSNQASIRGAQEVGADSVPAARLHLQYERLAPSPVTDQPQFAVADPLLYSCERA